ncbi:hypothetical protein V6N13_038035 [Hibiscus sabdariffa]
MYSHYGNLGGGGGDQRNPKNIIGPPLPLPLPPFPQFPISDPEFDLIKHVNESLKQGGTIYFIIAVTVILNFVAFIVTKQNCFLNLSVAFIASVGEYLGFFRTKIKRKFKIRVTPVNGFQTLTVLLSVRITPAKPLNMVLFRKSQEDVRASSLVLILTDVNKT